MRKKFIEKKNDVLNKPLKIKLYYYTSLFRPVLHFIMTKGKTEIDKCTFQELNNYIFNHEWGLRHQRHVFRAAEPIGVVLL